MAAERPRLTNHIGCQAMMRSPCAGFWHRVVMIVVATTEDELDGVCDRLRALGVRSMDVVAPSDTRRVVLAPVVDEWSVAGFVVSLRAEGVMAVTRPDRGTALQTRMARGGRDLAVAVLAGRRLPSPGAA